MNERMNGWRGGIGLLQALACAAALGCAASSTNSGGGGGDAAAGGDGVGSCEQTITSGTVTLRQCFDYAGLTADQVTAIRGTCMNGQDAGLGASVEATFRTSACDRTGAIGGCRIAAGSFMQTIWYFNSVAGLDPNTWRQACTTANGTWVTP